MIVVDTNLLSEPFKMNPDPGVIEWLREHRDDLAITSVSVAELLHGVLRLPDGRRRDALRAGIEALVVNAQERLLGFDEAAARQYAELRAARETAGHVVSVEDTMIAAICRARGCALATRNAKDFADAGIRVINPWRSGA